LHANVILSHYDMRSKKWAKVFLHNTREHGDSTNCEIAETFSNAFL